MELVPVVTVRGDGAYPELWGARARPPSHVRRSRTVKQVLEEAGPNLTITVPLDERSRQLLARAAELPDHGFLRDIAARGGVEVSVAQLTTCDPDDEAIVGFELSWSQREAELLDVDAGLPQARPRQGIGEEGPG